MVNYKQLLDQSAELQTVTHQRLTKTSPALPAEMARVARYLGVPAEALKGYVTRITLVAMCFKWYYTLPPCKIQVEWLTIANYNMYRQSRDVRTMELIDVLGVKRRAKVNENVDYGIKALTWTLRNHGVRESKTRFYLRIYCNHRYKIHVRTTARDMELVRFQNERNIPTRCRKVRKIKVGEALSCSLGVK